MVVKRWTCMNYQQARLAGQMCLNNCYFYLLLPGERKICSKKTLYPIQKSLIEPGEEFHLAILYVIISVI